MTLAITSRRWSVGTLQRRGNDVDFTYFSDRELGEHNGGRNYSQLRDAGFQGYPAFPLREAQFETFPSALSAFLRRVPPRSRSDFGQYLSQFHLGDDVFFSDLALLAITEARLPSDGFSLVDPLDGDDAVFQTVVELAGYHYYTDKISPEMTPGDRLELVPEPTNEYDPHALRVEWRNTLIGYINRLQAPRLVRSLGSRDVSLWLSRLNGSRSKPRAFGLLSVSASQERAAA